MTLAPQGEAISERATQKPPGGGLTFLPWQRLLDDAFYCIRGLVLDHIGRFILDRAGYIAWCSHRGFLERISASRVTGFLTDAVHAGPAIVTASRAPAVSVIDFIIIGIAPLWCGSVVVRIITN